jgi:hypothetical protein
MLASASASASASAAASAPVGAETGVAAPTAPIPIIGIRGDMGAGKDTLAAEICRLIPVYAVRKYATALREAVEIVTDIPVARTMSAEDKGVDLSRRTYSADDLVARLIRAIAYTTGDPTTVLDASQAESMFRILTGVAYAAARESGMPVCIPMTVGRLLQVLGTECFRQCLYDTVWVEALFTRWKKEKEPPVVISDVRFPEETAEIWRRGGVVVTVRRAGAARADGRATEHLSEHALGREEADAVFDNDGSIEELRRAFAARLPDLTAQAAARAPASRGAASD